MPYDVRLTDDASADLDELYAHIAENDSMEKAEYVLGRIDKVVSALARQPNRGVIPAELSKLGIRDYRELFFKPYRIIYRVIGKTAFVFLIVDGRRDMQALLKRRLLSP